MDNADIIAWYRNGGECAERGEQCRVMEAASGCNCALAADEITRLRAEVERLTKEAVGAYNDGLHDGSDAASDRWAKDVASHRAEVSRLRAAAHDMLDHHYNCRGSCPQYDKNVAHLARASGYKNNLFEDEISAALTQPAQPAPEKDDEFGKLWS
jgi:hypothetical protein